MRMLLIVSLCIHCLRCYVMSPVFWTFFRTQELGLSLQVPVSWNEPLISNPVKLTRQLASHFITFSVLLFLFTNRRDEHRSRLGPWFVFYYFYFYEEINTATHDTLCTLTKFHLYSAGIFVIKAGNIRTKVNTRNGQKEIVVNENFWIQIPCYVSCLIVFFKYFFACIISWPKNFVAPTSEFWASVTVLVEISN